MSIAVEYVKSAQFGGINVAVRRGPTANGNPTLILLNSLSTDGNLYTAQFANAALTASYNLVAIDLFGHGFTGGLAEVVTYWDHARIVNDVVHGMGLKSASILGTSQGGFIAARCALLEPELISSIIICGSSLFAETSRLGCWDIEALLAPAINFLSLPEHDDSFVLPQAFTDDIVVLGLGPAATQAQKDYAREVHERVYGGAEGRKRYLMILDTLRFRDQLSPEQLGSLSLPILVLHGTDDIVYSVPLMREWSALLTAASPLEVNVIEGGNHFLNASNPVEADAFVLNFLRGIKL